jgi:hypothetical protein
VADENGPRVARVYSLPSKRIPRFFVILARHHSEKHPRS